MNEVLLINPRNSLAPPSENGKEGHLWKPDSLITLAARLEVAGIRSCIFDENLRQAPDASDIIGLTVVGAPWIPVVRQRILELSQNSPRRRFIIGGQLAAGLSQDETEQLFGPNVWNGMISGQLERILDTKKPIPTREAVSVRNTLCQMSDSDLEKYLRAESSIYIADGCHFNCSFCAAKKGQKESYRDFHMLQEELDFLFSKASELGIEKLRLYATNLDLLQNPESLLKVVDIIQEVKGNYPEIELVFRGLSTLISAIKVSKKYSHLLGQLRNIGLDRLDFGVDGSPETWGRIGKKINHLSILNQPNDTPNTDHTEAVVDLIKSADIDVGLFMVIGHPSVDDAASLKAAYKMLRRQVLKSGVIPRPYVATNNIPGQSIWSQGSPEKDFLMENPRYFYALEYAALASHLKGQSPRVIRNVNECYRDMLKLPGCTTKLVEPILPDPHMNEGQRQAAIIRNYGQYDL